MPALRILDHDATLEMLAEIAQNPLNQTLSGLPKFFIVCATFVLRHTL